MPILGLFPTGAERQYNERQNAIASGRQSSAAVRDIQGNANLARRAAFSTAYAQRGNAALAQRQAVNAGAMAQAAAGQQIASQRAHDVEAAQQEQKRAAAEQAAGINNAIGFGAQAMGTIYGGPAGGAVAKGAAGALTDQVSPVQSDTKPLGAASPGLFTPPATATPSAPQTMGGAGTMSLVQGANAPVPTQASPQGMQAVQQALVPSPVQAPLTQPDAVPVNTGLAALYDRPGNQRDPAVDADWRRRFGQAYWGGQ